MITYLKREKRDLQEEKQFQEYFSMQNNSDRFKRYYWVQSAIARLSTTRHADDKGDHVAVNMEAVEGLVCTGKTDLRIEDLSQPKVVIIEDQSHEIVASSPTNTTLEGHFENVASSPTSQNSVYLLAPSDVCYISSM
jgi:hypothetical protein